MINLRGKVIPVVDLRLRSSIESHQFDERTCILVVDAVSEVANIKAKEIEPTPSFGTILDTEHILGMTKNKPQVRILLKMDKVFHGQELSTLHNVA